MREDRKSHKWVYTEQGKVLRGILCLMTFAVAIAGTTIIAYILSMFGESILYEPDRSYYSTSYYYRELANDLSRLLYDAKDAYWEKDLFSLSEIGTGKMHIYNYEQMQTAYEEGNHPATLPELNVYEKYSVGNDKVKKTYMCDYDSAYACLRSLEGQNAYLYLEQQDFIDLIETVGYQNTGYRISTQFSEDAYFVFTYKTASGRIGEYNAEKMQTAYKETMDTTVSNTVSTSLEENEEQWEVTVKEPNENTEFPDLGEVGYLVYDPKEEVFYSPWDDYFKSMDTYIYSVDELLAAINENGIKAVNTDSILFPMIWSHNFTVEETFQNAIQIRLAMQAAEADLADIKGFKFYIRQSQKVCSNVDHRSEVSALKEHYEIAGTTVPPTGSTFRLAELIKDTGIKDMLAQFPSNTDFIFGVDEKEASTMDSTGSTRGFVFYNFFQSYGGCIELGTLVAWLALIEEAIGMIRITGRRYRGDPEVKICRFDHWPTEVWGICCVVVLAAAVTCTFRAAKYVVRTSAIRMDILMGLAVGSTFPLGLSFMLLTLSFARRVKAHNLRTRSWMVQFVTKWRKGFWYNIKNATGASRLFAAMLGYVLCNMAVVLGIVVYNDSDIRNILFLVFLLMQIMACMELVRIIRDGRNLLKGIDAIKQGDLSGAMTVKEHTKLFQELADGVNHISDGLQAAVETSLKDERMKTELITNVSHDLKTPLTSIINYINLLKDQEMPTPEAEHYVEVLEGKAQRLRHLTEDLVEAAKATSGNIELEMMPLAFDELMKQSLGEFDDKFATRGLSLVASYPEQTVMVMVDGRRMFRVLENILQNAYKYSMEGTRVYADLSCENNKIVFVLKNISAAALNISPEELMERFTRGDTARSTEGSGLGLSIAKDLTRLQGGEFEIQLDGDLFKVVITLPEYT